MDGLKQPMLRNTLTLIFRRGAGSSIHPAAALLSEHKHVANHRAAHLGHLLVGQPNDPVDLNQPEAEGEKDSKEGGWQGFEAQ